MHTLSLIRGLFLVVTPVVFAFTSLTAYAQTDELPNVGLAPHSAGGYVPDAVIVKFRPSANASSKARARGLVNAELCNPILHSLGHLLANTGLGVI